MSVSRQSNQLEAAVAANGKPKLVAFYLPQFHPFPENDSWWGKGFTEWTNVTKAKPLFAGHYQPHLPADLGFYDLRVAQVRRDQESMASRYGISAFCYHYYWFSGTRLLHQPLFDKLNDPESELPFCLCWANENWTRRWDGDERQVLIAQNYRIEDELNFIRDLEPFLRDSRYMRVDGKLFLIVYRPQLLPDVPRAVATWRSFCREQQIGELHLCAAFTSGNQDYREFGFDSGVEFPPHGSDFRDLSINHMIGFSEAFKGFGLDYQRFAETFLNRTYGRKRVFRTVVPSWDNTARIGNRAVFLANANPSNYEVWLSRALALSKDDFSGQDQLVFINAWNEWAEGCHLEPDREYGHQVLEATNRALTASSPSLNFSSLDNWLAQHNPPPGFIVDLVRLVKRYRSHWFDRLNTALKGFPLLRRVLSKAKRVVMRFVPDRG